jgi:hypothetical protein
MRNVAIFSRVAAETIEFGSLPVVSITDNADPPAELKTTGDICRASFPDSSYGMDIVHWEISKIFKFLEKHKDAEQLIVHCAQGKSRSSAVALFCCEEYGARADFQFKFPNLEVVRRLRELRDIRNRIRHIGDLDPC